MEKKNGPWSDSKLIGADLVKFAKEHRKNGTIAIVDGDHKKIHPE